MLKDHIFEDDGLSKEERKEKISELQDYLSGNLQRLTTEKLPVLVLVEGYSAAGKGTLINKLISEIDPRYCTVFNYEALPIEERRYPYLHPFFCALPEEGKIQFMDLGWMEDAVRNRLSGDWDARRYRQNVLSARRFERQLKNNGYLVIKLFMAIDRETQKERLDNLRKKESTAWRVDAHDLRQNVKFDEVTKAYDDFMQETGESFPWHILDGSNSSKASYNAFRIITDAIRDTFASGKYNGAPYEEEFPLVEMPKLKDVDLSLSLTQEEYKKELKRLQDSIEQLQYKIKRKNIPVIIAYEGWDAAGKGGNIKRLAYPLDPRGMKVHPIGSPEPHEKARHFLYKFYTRLPETGCFAIFDRTWYGRVMVERLEGFCTENDWKRAYNEINEFEEDMVNWGALVLKFWIDIDSDTQLQRFQDRQNTPEKQWKITDEDWRNRDKWDQYEVAVDEMLEKTSTKFAPWHIIESVDKKYARIKVLRIVEEALTKALNK